MFEEWDHRGRDRECLIGGNVYKVNLITGNKSWFSQCAHFNILVGNVPLLIIANRGVSNVVTLLFKSVHIYDIFRDLPFYHFRVWCFDNAEIIHARIGGETKNETDVWTFRCVDRTKSAVVGWVNVTHFKTCSFPSEAARTKRGERAQVFNFSKRVVLRHELRKLVCGKKFFDTCLKRARTDELYRKGCVGIDGGHSVLNISLHLRHSNAHFLLHHLSHGTHAARSQVVDIIRERFGCVVECYNVASNRHDIIRSNRSFFDIGFSDTLTKSSVEFKTAYF